MNESKILRLSASITSIIFHPLLIPTIGFLLLFSSGFYFSIIPWNLKWFILLVVFTSTCLIPLISIGLLSVSSRFDIKMEKGTDRVLPLIFSSVSFYMGYLILGKIQSFPVFQIFLIASILVQIALVLISLQWKISAHAAAIGGLVGGFFALSVRLQENPVAILTLLILFSGMVCTSRLILQKHNGLQVYAGFLLGFLIMGLSILFA
jgi:membrane-associated phospholipid phosphatase